MEMNGLVRLAPRNRADMRGHINSLPPETLSEIFLALRDSAFVTIERLQPVRESRVTPRPLKRMYAWTKVLLVSKYWNATACSCPALWSHVDLGRRRYWLHLDRAKKTPLTLVSLIPASGIPTFMLDETNSKELVHTERIMIQHTRSWGSAFDRLTSLPMLRDLRLSRNVNPSGYDPKDKLPEVFTSGEFPKLRCVQLLNYHVDWRYPIFTENLRTLRVDFSTCGADPTLGQANTLTGPSPRPTFEDTIAALGRMPALEELGLHDCQQKITDNLRMKPQITLTHLRYLSIYGAARPCAHYLNAINRPASANVSLQTSRTSHSPMDFLHLFAALSNQLSGSHSVGPATAFQCMLAQEDPDCQNQRHCGLRLHFLRPDESLGDDQYNHILAHRMSWAMDTTAIWDPQFKGIQFLIYTSRFNLAATEKWSAGDLVRSVACHIGKRPLQDIKTLMMMAEGSFTAGDIHLICPNVTTLILGPNRSRYYLGETLDHLVGPQLVSNTAARDGPEPQPTQDYVPTVVRPYWPALRTLVLQPDVNTLCTMSLDKVYSYLLAREEMCAFEYKELLLFTVDNVQSNALKALNKLQRRFPQLTITLHTHPARLIDEDLTEG
ncbi:hypothetical protein BC835DRAFT_1524235 [Cytidiella melzeri]|nr:hypothetical protein BC835DRAFT_1524235 [Cytidiella melzeri]